MSALSATRAAFIAVVCFLASLAPSTVEAQGVVPHRQVISANPFGLLIGFFNAEYERKVSPGGTAGVGGSFFEDTDLNYVNVDLFYRFYPSERTMDGFAVGVKAGITSVSDFNSYFGFGFDVSHSWLLGTRDNFYVGIGFGLKRLYGTPDEDEDPFDDVLKIIPTFRLLNIGIAF